MNVKLYYIGYKLIILGLYVVGIKTNKISLIYYANIGMSIRCYARLYDLEDTSHIQNRNVWILIFSLNYVAGCLFVMIAVFNFEFNPRRLISLILAILFGAFGQFIGAYGYENID